jgi:hypothetical protein
MWAELVEWAKKHLLTFQPPLASAEDMNIPMCAATADDAITLIRQHHASWVKSQKATA